MNKGSFSHFILLVVLCASADASNTPQLWSVTQGLKEPLLFNMDNAAQSESTNFGIKRQSSEISSALIGSLYRPISQKKYLIALKARYEFNEAWGIGGGYADKANIYIDHISPKHLEQQNRFYTHFNLNIQEVNFDYNLGDTDIDYGASIKLMFTFFI